MAINDSVVGDCIYKWKSISIFYMYLNILHLHSFKYTYGLSSLEQHHKFEKKNIIGY
jgi:hypothetical protein